MAQIRYRVPYQVDVDAYDLTSSKKIGNTLYLASGVQTAPEPSYNSPIMGGGSTATLLASFKTRWEVLVNGVLSTKYQLRGYTMRAITGYGYNTPQRVINGLVVNATTITIQTSVPHGFTPTSVIRIQGVTIPAAANGTFTPTILNPTQFTIPVTTTGIWSNDGTAQIVFGRMGFLYSDKEELASSATGGVSGDALPIYCDVDVRRLNAGVGKSFRSRFAASPIGEADNDFGKLNSTAIVTWAAALLAFNVGMSNGGTDSGGSEVSYNQAVSRKIASQQPLPFTGAPGIWSFFVSSMVAHVRLGSQNQRKPRLSGV